MLPDSRETALFEVSDASPADHSYHIRIKLELSMKHRWNDTDMGKPKCLEKNLFLYHLVNHKSHTDWGIELTAGAMARPNTGRPSSK